MSPLLGAHVSIAGGLPLAVDRAVALRCDAFQIFTKNASQWRGRRLPRQEIFEFRRKLAAAGIGPVVAHASYLINLAAAGAVLRRRSIEAMEGEIDRAEALGLLGVVLHPGAFTTSDEASGLELVADSLLTVLRRHAGGRTMVLLEQTAGQGTSLGATFEQLAALLARTGHHQRVGICLDTCHLFAAGYELRSPEGYAETLARFDRVIGLDRLKVFHLNDSKRPLGSRLDRHEHIGKGRLGLEPFRRLVNDDRVREVPMLLETPKEAGRPNAAVRADRCDARNLRTLRRLVDA